MASERGAALRHCRSLHHYILKCYTALGAMDTYVKVFLSGFIHPPRKLINAVFLTYTGICVLLYRASIYDT